GGSLAGQDFNKDIYIPIQTFFGRIGDKNIRWQKGSVSAEEVELSQITLSVPTREAVTPTAEVVRESLNLTHPERDFAVVVPLELLRQAEQIRTIFGIVLGSIAAISLLVGGIGIMNIMLATVTERTREIGIRRALGARRRDIIGQFLGETVVLAGTGGLVGIGCGLLTPAAFYLLQQLATGLLAEGVADSATGRLFTDMQPTVALWSLPLAFGISVGTGVAFGLYPARAAAMMDPIEALRRQ
ncbi:MAG: FtsX-like permease family protein, partial [Planctomycetota bacterium]